MTTFERDFRTWLASVLSQGVPDRVVGFTFNLFECTTERDDSRFGVELVGTASFDPSDSDWACDEVWEPSGGRSISIPTAFSGESWEECLAKMKSLVTDLLDQQTNVSAQLRSVAGIGLGFVDGDLLLLGGSTS